MSAEEYVVFSTMTEKPLQENEDARGEHALTSLRGLNHDDLGADQSRRKKNPRKQAGLQMHLA